MPIKSRKPRRNKTREAIGGCIIIIGLLLCVALIWLAWYGIWASASFALAHYLLPFSTWAGWIGAILGLIGGFYVAAKYFGKEFYL